MNVFIAALISIYSKLLLLYPRGFRKEFGEEMEVVFGGFSKRCSQGYVDGNETIDSVTENWILA